MRNRRTIYRARRLRKTATVAEKALWKRLRDHQLNGWGFRRQADVGVYVVDFLCHAPRLVVELDGPIHEEAEQEAFDKRRDKEIEALGFAIFRLNERFVREAPEEAIMLISAIGRRALEGLPPIPDDDLA